MWKSIYDQVHHLTVELGNWLVWLWSFLLGAFLSAIGYPKEVLSFLFWLIMIDLVTKHYAIVRAKFGTFTLRNYFKGWTSRILTSRSIKDGLGVKAMLYTPVLYIAHKLTVVDEILLADTMSLILYSLLVIIEIISILENFDDAGHREVAPFLKLFRKRKRELLGEEGEGNEVHKDKEV